MLLYEMVPAALAAEITTASPVPVIGIGAGVGCSGQVLVLHDMLDVTQGRKKPRFVKNFMEGMPSVRAAIERYVAEVKAKTFPSTDPRLLSMRVLHSIAELRGRSPPSRCAASCPPWAICMTATWPWCTRRVALSAAGRGDRQHFVNRLQFAPHEDFDRYQALARDCELLEGAGCDVVFAPDERELYPSRRAARWCRPPSSPTSSKATSAPAFFTGVCTVVAKLFNIVQPSHAVFGKKDYQQLMVLRAWSTRWRCPSRSMAARRGAAEGLALVPQWLPERGREGRGLAATSRTLKP